VRSLAVFVFIIVLTGPARSDDTWPAPRTLSYTADWSAARDALSPIPSKKDADDLLAVASSVAAKRFPGIAQSPLPVLLPFAFDTDPCNQPGDCNTPPGRLLSGFSATEFFHVGPTGYDATFTLRMQDVPGLSGIAYRYPVVVQISGFNLLYDLPQPKGAVEQPVAADLATEFPGIRRQILEHTLRYSFERFGIPYVVSIQCFEGPQRRNRLACRNADRIAQRFLGALRVAGGNPSVSVAASPPAAAARPAQQSDAFRYHPVGKLIAGSGMRAAAGVADPTVYARIRFPAAEAPAYVNTQAFRRRGGLVVAWAPADEADGNGSKPEPAKYIWRDNFCERRDFAVGQCPSGRGHQGQDILGVSCTPGPRKRDCPANRDAVVAAREGMILREPWHDSFFLVTNAPGERMRFRHLHMHPQHLDAGGIVSGRVVSEGEPLGTISNFSRRPGMTTTHLHFELQVPTRDGYVRVNPYMTLVAAYEHLIGARGREIAASDMSGSTAERAPVATKSASKPRTRYAKSQSRKRR